MRVVGVWFEGNEREKANKRENKGIKQILLTQKISQNKLQLCVSVY